MWFDPCTLSKTETIPPANCEPESSKKALPISKLAELAAPLDSEIIIDGLLSAVDRQIILNWLASIGEEDQEIIKETIDRCKAAPDTLSYFLQRADGIVRPH